MYYETDSIKIEDLFNGIAIPSFIVKDNVIIKCNNQFACEFFNIETDPTGKKLNEIHIWLRPEDKDEIMIELSKEKKISNKLIQLRNSKGIKNKYLLTLGIIYGDNNFIIGSLLNVTEFMDQGSKYAKLQSKYSDLLDSTQTSMVLIDEDRKIKECNKAFLNIIESTSDAIIGSDLLLLFRSNGALTLNNFKKKIEEMSSNNKTILFKNIEMQITTLNNTVKWVFINMSTYGDNQIVLIMNEITEIKLNESKKYINVEKSKDKLKQGLMSIMQTIRSEEIK